MVRPVCDRRPVTWRLARRRSRTAGGWLRDRYKQGNRGEKVTADLAMQLMGDMLITALLIGAPVLGFSMLVGLAVSLLQVVTQIQEMSLTFIPKIITVVVTIFLFGPWMLRKLLAYSSTVIENIPNYF